ncbi:diaminopimelate decarboxylase [Acetobacter nitrogenifigens DSM 23921 = NBRC 105050]|uniref:Diaminopimelate decarboxylase n=1 Tax=Acetobacter nitrogenifigens DSM 23921 = NBRC 105050 TaxID=1120919 RepID=A0A511X5G0_9PROT|nr:diaminopimelate decarboxylase [Acetobacter nitrogenifigens]GBQ98180.1 diaminopimelate decarboxylase [Acetobacter nitrogenifigens DSM 23921 = NBRC 105050]GEN58181.1 diaminopimelate decarboxylase [Acetobacter nitrogenifigens DSM 23921 = NBRC 105050]
MADAPDLSTPDPTVRELLATRPQLSLDPTCGLMMEGVPLSAVADEIGTPTWGISASTLRIRARRLLTAMTGAGLSVSVHFAVKSNDHLAVLRILASEGLGADVVSGGELLRALEAGVPASKIVFSGVGKSDAELRLAIQKGVAQINVESAEELEIISALAVEAGRVVDVALRVNPDVDAETHAKITTGLADNKFGVPYDEALALYLRAAALPGVRPVGYAAHIGSQILKADPYRAAYARVAQLVRATREAGAVVSVVDCGGGLGIGYRDEGEGSPEAFAGAIRAELGDLDVRLAIEPGRWISGPSGVLLSTVILRKAVTGGAPFIVLDAAMNDLLRPSLYDAWHGVLPLSPHDAVQEPEKAHLVGPVCESGDCFARDRMLPPLQRGARVAFLDAGAYGSVMSSTYNARPLAAQVLVEGERWAVIRPRQTVEALWANETTPGWLNGDA